MHRLACPFCASSKIMLEGGDNWVACVCQKCLATGPQASNENPNAAIQLWNEAIRLPTKDETVKCRSCGGKLRLVYYGTCKEYRWRHVGKGTGCKTPTVKSSLAAPTEIIGGARDGLILGNKQP